ncbi:MAG: YihA family ribosome biogenesis GTP-binding protein, partial [Syntrophomonadaceae bacterium]|nr:YihA family ribosome biogenesis GTP-binding protein [Syntrophomonadaceae bacterium]
YGFARVSREERRRWGAMVEGYLKGSTRLRGVVLLLDIRHDPGELDRQMWQWLDHYGIRRLVVATKADKVSRGQRPRHLARIRRALGTQAMPICFSAITGEGSEELEAAIAGLLQAPLSQG